MSLLIDLLNGYIFSGVPSNAIWDLIKAGWREVTRKSWEDLYIDAFRDALKDLRPMLSKYAQNGEISLSSSDLYKVLHQDLAINLDNRALSELSSKDFAIELAAEIGQKSTLRIGGHTLTLDDYSQLVRVLIGSAHERFRSVILVNDNAFRRALLNESLHVVEQLHTTQATLVNSQSLLYDVQAYLAHHFDLVLDKLDKISGEVDDIKRILSQQEQIVEVAVDITSHYDSINNSFNHTIAYEFFGSYFRFVDLSNVEPASNEMVRQYYKGDLWLSWEIIAAKGDVERDKYGQLVQRLTNNQRGTHLLCLIGDPGSGKSTLAWRIASQIAMLTQRPLLQVLDSKADEPWGLLESAAQRLAMPLTVLADDVFRNDAAQRALEMLSPSLALTIIVTSRSNEVPNDLRLPFQLWVEDLDAPTQAEKARVLLKLGITERDLTVQQRKRLQRANSWLVMMAEIATGESLAKVVRNNLKHLKQYDDITYRAYEYLCYAGQFDLNVPESLLTSLDTRGSFYNLIDRSASKGLIFVGKGLENRASGKRHLYKESLLRVQHPTIAQEALRVYKRDPLNILGDFIQAIHPDQGEQVFFF